MAEETNEEHRTRLIQQMDERKEFVQDVDGFVYYWPKGLPSSHLSEHHLRWIADELKERNKEWQTIVDTMPQNKEVSEQDANHPTT